MSQDNLLSKPKHIISLASSCVLISVESHVWNATVQDKQISDEVTTAKKADKNAGKFIKNLLAKNTEHKAVLNYRQTIYNWFIGVHTPGPQQATKIKELFAL